MLNLQQGSSAALQQHTPMLPEIHQHTVGVPTLYRECRLQADDFLRCAAVPKRKGANFRDLPGVHTWGNGMAA